jgi:hypothetical protein
MEILFIQKIFTTESFKKNKNMQEQQTTPPSKEAIMKWVSEKTFTRGEDYQKRNAIFSCEIMDSSTVAGKCYSLTYGNNISYQQLVYFLNDQQSGKTTIEDGQKTNQFFFFSSFYFSKTKNRSMQSSS